MRFYGHKQTWTAQDATDQIVLCKKILGWEAADKAEGDAEFGIEAQELLFENFVFGPDAQEIKYTPIQGVQVSSLYYMETYNVEYGSQHLGLIVYTRECEMRE